MTPEQAVETLRHCVATGRWSAFMEDNQPERIQYDEAVRVLADALAALSLLEQLAEAAEQRINDGHGKNCSWPYSDERHTYPCDCGHFELHDALAAVRAGRAGA